MLRIQLALFLVFGIVQSLNAVEQRPVLGNSALEIVGDIACTTVTAYFNGTFKPQNRPNFGFDAQFQIKLWFTKNMIVRPGGSIVLQIQHWNDIYLSESEVYFDIWLVGQVYQRCYLNQPCTVDIDGQSASTLYIGIATHNSDWFGTRLLRFPLFLDSFTLQNAYKQCTNYQVQDQNNFADTSLYKYCACCGDYKPDATTYCPASPWRPHTNN
ncbi:hypothetical protein M3Y97_00658000 [Aphelenchoides bicaudatus]|nr:hypothetical protein M3Y97_00658000 [Aphelenchoides bicaudatus]